MVKAAPAAPDLARLVEAAKEMREAILYSPDFDGDTINHFLALWDSIMPVPIDAALAAYEAPDPIEAEYQRAAVEFAEADFDLDALPDTDWDVWMRAYGPALERVQSAFAAFVAARAAKRGGEGR